MVAKGKYDLMANRSDRRLPTLFSVRAHQHEADRMIRDSGARISIKATGATHAPDQIGRIYDRNQFSSAVSHPCIRAGSIYDRRRRFATKSNQAATGTALPSNLSNRPSGRIFILTLRCRGYPCPGKRETHGGFRIQSSERAFKGGERTDFGARQAASF